MRTYEQLYTDCKNLSGNDDWESRFKTLVNETHETVVEMQPWSFMTGETDIATTDDGASYLLPPNVSKVLAVRMDDETFEPPTFIDDWNEWQRLQSLESGATDVPEYFTVREGSLLMHPATDTAGNTLKTTVRYRHADMSVDDYTTGTVTTLAADGTAVTGNGTAWTSAMVGRHIRIEKPDGDNRYYPITAVGSTTTLTVGSAWLGSAISGGSASYRIGEMPLIPGPYQSLLKWRPLAIFYDAEEKPGQSQRNWMLYDGGYEAGLSPVMGGMLGRMKAEYGSEDDSPFILPPYRRPVRDPNSPPTDLSGFS